MLKKLSRKLRSSSKKKAIPEYEGPIQKRIILLGNIKDLATGLVNDCTRIIKKFDQEEEGPLRNMCENLAINMKLLANAVKNKDEQYADFLVGMHASYDQIGRAQRKFQADLKEQVIDPLNAWLLTDYARMNDEITKLHERKRDMDKANECLGKPEIKRDDHLLAEQTAKEFERQMEIVKLELLKLTAIKNEHAGLFYNFLECYKNYHKSVAAVFEELGADKWVSSIDGVK